MGYKMTCSACGAALYYKDWEANRICPVCGNPAVYADIKEVHIFFGDSQLQGFDMFISNEDMDAVLQRKRNGNGFKRDVDYHRVTISYELCIGDISNPPYSNANYYAHNCGSYRIAIAQNERSFEKLNSVDGTVPIYIWLNSYKANDYMNLLYFAKFFKRFENVFSVKWNHDEEDFYGSEVTMIKAIEKKTRLTALELDEFSSRFAEIQGWNAEYLLGNSDYVEPWQFSRLEKYVLSFMNNEYRHFGRIYWDVRDAVEKDTTFIVDSRMFQEAIHRLNMVGKIESHGACMWWGDDVHCNVGLFTQRFRKSKRRTQKLSYDDIVGIICDSFVYGYTYGLYSLLDDDSTLAVDGQTISGKWGIIEYIENDGAYRVHNCNQSVECTLIEDKDGDDRNDRAHILLTYEKQATREHFLGVWPPDH